MDEQPQTESEQLSVERAPRSSRRALSADELESGLTDVCAEMYYLEAERLRTAELMAGATPSAAGLSEVRRLSERRGLIESRLEALEARAAGIRARVERARKQSA